MAEKQRASKRQQELLSFVDGFIKGNGYGPSYREIMRALDYKSVSTVATHIEGLIAKGYLSRRDNSARSLEVVTLRPDNPLVQPATATSLEDQIIAHIKTIELPEDQLKDVAGTFELIGMKKVHDAVAPADKTQSPS